jgi:hypothetical protein
MIQTNRKKERNGEMESQLGEPNPRKTLKPNGKVIRLQIDVQNIT